MRSGELIAGDRGARSLREGDLARAWAVLEQVMDPEVPVVSVVDLGIVRDLDWRAGHLHLVVTPTYSGCPATEVIEGDIRQALEQAGFAQPALERRLTPAWSSDWISDQGREPCGNAKFDAFDHARQVARHCQQTDASMA